MKVIVQITHQIKPRLSSNFFPAGRIPDCPKPHILDEDVDVGEERQRIYQSGKSNDILRVRDLSKVSVSLY